MKLSEIFVIVIFISLLLILLACGGEGNGDTTCIDNDGDGYGPNCASGNDCDDADENNWISCATCEDSDGDDYFVDCDAYFTISGPDCDDVNPLIHPDAPESACNTIDDNCNGQTDEVETVSFEDANLEARVRTAISKPDGDILNSDLCSLNFLNASEYDISDLTGLEYCTELTELYLYENSFTDISILSTLTNLTLLNLTANQITDIQSLVDNSGIGAGDEIYVYSNLLDVNDCDEIETLEGRGATVYHSLTCP